MARIETKLAERGLMLPQPLQPGVVLPFPEVNLRGDRAYVSGAGPLNDDWSLAGPIGKVGVDVCVEDTAGLAQKTGLAILGGLKRELGDLDRITGWCRVFGMVNCDPGFEQQPAATNRISHPILDLFGSEIGRHARSAVGVAALPLRIAVEIEAEFQIAPAA